MNKQGTKDRGDQGPARLEQLLRQALPPVGNQADSPRDLWPAVKLGLHTQPSPTREMLHVPWFDLALGCGLITLLVFFPAWIPVLLYYL